MSGGFVRENKNDNSSGGGWSPLGIFGAVVGAAVGIGAAYYAFSGEREQPQTSGRSSQPCNDRQQEEIRRQERMRQEQLQQVEIQRQEIRRQERMRQEQLRQEEIRRQEIRRQEQLWQEELRRPERERQERERQENFRNRANSLSTCVICIEVVSDPDDTWRLNCGHTYHRSCMAQWAQRKEQCPICQRAIQAD